MAHLKIILNSISIYLGFKITQAVARENKFLEYWTKPGDTFGLGGTWGVVLNF